MRRAGRRVPGGVGCVRRARSRPCVAGRRAPKRFFADFRGGRLRTGCSRPGADSLFSIYIRPLFAVILGVTAYKPEKPFSPPNRKIKMAGHGFGDTYQSYADGTEAAFRFIWASKMSRSLSSLSLMSPMTLELTWISPLLSRRTYRGYRSSNNSTSPRL